MTKPKRYRWKCPACSAGRLLGKQPRKTATARYCIPCSIASGTLTELVCPTLDKQRTKAKAKGSTKANAKRDASGAKFIVNGIDLRDDLRAIYSAARKLEPNLPPYLPRFTVYRSKRHKFTSGRAWSTHRVHVTAGTIPREVFAVMVHEVAHLMTYARGARGHGDIFKAAETELQREVGSPTVAEARKGVTS